jgi:hypothetical protein
MELYIEDSRAPYGENPSIGIDLLGMVGLKTVHWRGSEIMPACVPPSFYEKNREVRVSLLKSRSKHTPSQPTAHDYVVIVSRDNRVRHG